MSSLNVILFTVTHVMYVINMNIYYKIIDILDIYMKM